MLTLSNYCGQVSTADFLRMKNVLFTIILVGFAFIAMAPAASAVDVPAILEKCWQFSADYNPKIGIASDNVSEIYLVLNDGRLASLSDSGLILWKAETGGEIISNLLYIDKTLLFLLRINDRKTPAIIRAISSVTGITRWQTTVTLTDDSQLKAIALTRNQLSITESGGRTHIVQPHSDESGEIFGASADVRISKVASLSTKADERNIFYLDNGDRINADTAGRVDYLPNSRINKSWSARLGGGILSISESRTLVYLSSADNYLYAFRRSDGKLAWRRRFESKIESIFDQENNVLITSLINGRKTVITDAKSGQIVNAVMLDEDRYFVGAPQIIGSKIVLLQNDSVAAYQFNACGK
jgi:outer membrane protein assembly factor BamB